MARIPRQRRAFLNLETLEDRALLSGNSISGYVFHDLNNNGLRDATEAPLANSRIELRNAAGAVIGTTMTDALGFYRFDRDLSINTTPLTKSLALAFPEGQTNTAQSQALAKFNPALGTLVGVDFTINGRITSNIRAENLDLVSALITGTVSGGVLLNGPGLAANMATAAQAQVFNAAAYDGNADYAGPSGVTFGSRTVQGEGTFTVTNANDLAAYVGAGTINLALTAQATSSATGGGNLQALIGSTGGASVTVTYRYVPSDALRPGVYTIVQTTAPDGTIDGKDSRAGVVLPGSIGTNSIIVTLASADLANNNFGELYPGRVGGWVYIDTNNNGARDGGEVGTAGVTLTLTGTNDRGLPVVAKVVSALDGSYSFANLRPGTYIVTQTPPAGLLAGKIGAPGSLGGTAAVNRFSAIVVGSGGQGVDYNFAWLKAATLTGFVYLDANDNGLRDAGERGLAGVLIILSGTDDLGRAVRLPAVTAADGSYRFNNLRPGLYSIQEFQNPRGFVSGKNAVGSLGGVHATDLFSNIVVGVGDFGRDYNFAEKGIAAVDPRPSKRDDIISIYSLGRERRRTHARPWPRRRAGAATWNTSRRGNHVKTTMNWLPLVQTGCVGALLSGWLGLPADAAAARWRSTPSMPATTHASKPGITLGAPVPVRKAPVSTAAHPEPIVQPSGWWDPPNPLPSSPPHVVSAPLPAPLSARPEPTDALPAPIPSPVQVPATPPEPTAPEGTSQPVAPSVPLQTGDIGTECLNPCAPNACPTGRAHLIGPHGSPGRLYTRFEYLNWKFHDQETPPLVTIGTEASLGILTVDGTGVLFGGNISHDRFSGGRMTVGWWFDREEYVGIEGSFFMLAQKTVRFAAGSPTATPPGGPVIGRPIITDPSIVGGNLLPPGESVQLVSHDNTLAGIVYIAMPSRFWGTDLNLRGSLVSAYSTRGWAWHVDSLAGLRYMRLEEGLDITEDLRTLPDNVNGPDILKFVNDRFDTTNSFLGAQLGLEGELRYRRWFLNLRGKVALGATRQEVVINGRTVITDIPQGAPPAEFTGGILALPSNMGTFKRTVFSAVPELTLSVGYELTDHLRVFVGYNVMAWTSVVRPGPQVDRVVNPLQIPPTPVGVVLPVSPARPAFSFKDSTFWAHGMTAGLEWRF